MSGRRMIGGLVLLAGIVAAVAPLLVPVPDDWAFLSMFEQKDAGGEWTSAGAMSAGGRSYVIEIVQKAATNEAGETVSLEATLTATERSGETKVYRRTRYFWKGSPVESVRETPTRTVKWGRGPKGEDEFRETILVDNMPLLARPGVRSASHIVGAVMVVGGIVMLVLRMRERGAGAGAPPVTSR